MVSHLGPPRINGHAKHDRHRDPRQIYESTSMLSSDLESTSFFDSEDDSRYNIFAKLNYYLQFQLPYTPRLHDYLSVKLIL